MDGVVADGRIVPGPHCGPGPAAPLEGRYRALSLVGGPCVAGLGPRVYTGPSRGHSWVRAHGIDGSGAGPIAEVCSRRGMPRISALNRIIRLSVDPALGIDSQRKSAASFMP